jgi:hypothetical protein
VLLALFFAGKVAGYPGYAESCNAQLVKISSQILEILILAVVIKNDYSVYVISSYYE